MQKKNTKVDMATDLEDKKKHGSDIEARLDGSYYTVQLLKKENKMFINECRQ